MKNSWLRTGYCVLVLFIMGCQSIQGAHNPCDEKIMSAAERNLTTIDHDYEPLATFQFPYPMTQHTQLAFKERGENDPADLLAVYDASHNETYYVSLTDPPQLLSQVSPGKDSTALWPNFQWAGDTDGHFLNMKKTRLTCFRLPGDKFVCGLFPQEPTIHKGFRTFLPDIHVTIALSTELPKDNDTTLPIDLSHKRILHIHIPKTLRENPFHLITAPALSETAELAAFANTVTREIYLYHLPKISWCQLRQEEERKKREDPIVKLFSPNLKMEKGLRLVAMLPVGEHLKDIKSIRFNKSEDYLLVRTDPSNMSRYNIPLQGKPDISQTLKPIALVFDETFCFSSATWNMIVPHLEQWPVETSQTYAGVSPTGRFVAALNKEKTHILIFAFEQQRKPSRKLLTGTITPAMIGKLENDLPIQPISEKAKEELARIARNNLQPEPGIEKAYHLIGTITYSPDLQIGDIGLPRSDTLALALPNQNKTLFYNLRNWEQMAIREGIDATLFPLHRVGKKQLTSIVKYDETIQSIMLTHFQQIPLSLQPQLPRIRYTPPKGTSPDNNHIEYVIPTPILDSPFDVHSYVALSPSATKAAWLNATTSTIYVYRLRTRKKRAQ